MSVGQAVQVAYARWAADAWWPWPSRLQPAWYVDKGARWYWYKRPRQAGARCGWRVDAIWCLCSIMASGYSRWRVLAALKACWNVALYAMWGGGGCRWWWN